MKKRSAKIAGGALSVALAFSLAACGGSNTEDTSKNEGGKSSSGPQVELTLWQTWTDSASQPQQDRIKAFQEQHPEIKLNVESIAHDQYKIKLKTNAAGKQLPDIFQVWTGAELEPLVDAGLVSSLDNIKDHWKDKLISEDNLAQYQIDGKQYAIPGGMNLTNIIYYDKDLVAKAGYAAFPDSFTEFKSLITALNNQKVTPIALGNKAKWVLQSYYFSTIGDRFTGSDFLPAVLAGQKKFTDPEFVNGLKAIEEMVKLKAFNSDMNSIDNKQAIDVFLQGKSGMVIASTSALLDMLTKIPEGKNIGMAIFPQVEGGKGDPMAISGSAQHGLALNSQLSGAKREAAETFLKFFYDEKLYQSMISRGYLSPAKVQAPADTNALHKQLIELTANIKVAPVYDATLPANLTDIINNGLQAITVDAMTPEKLAADMQKAVK
ncbi:extracellular solute-binding protein [Paenibacillus sp. YN15]|uniref:extracellular solute-binding protein n=1 Tax=Paenibacillus sp. YN15 TaxID=1742774 RepID=UPI0015EBF712|nr:extracellular solute-binding protein [Paenibacillus sp. YN15]